MDKPMFPRLGIGLGLRTVHYPRVTGAPCPGIDWFEIISENFIFPGGNPRRVLELVRKDYPVVMHGVSLSIGSTDPLDEEYLDDLARLARDIEPALVSDHLCWSSLGGHTVHDLWPVPYTEEALAHVVSRVEHVQERLGRRILLENPSSYAVFAASELGEAEFLAEVARRADCGILLDVNNVFVSCKNNRWDPHAYLAALPAERIGQIHLAGHSDEGDLLIDTHDHAVCDPVWELYRDTIARLGHVSTLLERDDHIPPFDELTEEAQQARAIMEGTERAQLAG
jgi:uncharacterized protein